MSMEIISPQMKSKEFFKNGGLEEEHFQLIYEYLAGEKVRLKAILPKRQPF